MEKQLAMKLGETEVISFVGAGGKTTSIRRLAGYLKSQGKKVLCTTSTAINIPEEGSYDAYFLGSLGEEYRPQEASVTYYGQYERSQMLRNQDLEALEQIIARDLFDYILIEADGARRKPIKAPRDGEPVIVDKTSITLGLVGLDCLGKKIEDTVQRPEIFAQILGLNLNHVLEAADIIALARHEQGLFKDFRGKKILLLNKVKEGQLEKARAIRKELLTDGIDLIIEAWHENKK